MFLVCLHALNLQMYVGLRPQTPRTQIRTHTRLPGVFASSATTVLGAPSQLDVLEYWVPGSNRRLFLVCLHALKAVLSRGFKRAGASECKKVAMYNVVARAFNQVRKLQVTCKL